MRKNFVLFVLIPLILFLLVAWFYMDRWVEAGLETAGEALMGSRVEIDDLDVSLMPLAIRFDRLQVASTEDSLANLFETGTVKYVMNVAQLLRGKTIIDSIAVSDLILATRRSRSGFLPGGRRSSSSLIPGTENFKAVIDGLLQQVKASTPLFDPALWRGRVNIDSLIAAQNLATPVLVDSLQRLTAASAAEWDSTLKALDEAGRRLEEIKARLLGIRPAELRTVDEITRAIATVDAARKTVNELTAAYTERSTAINGKIETLTAATAAIDDALRADVSRVFALARLPDINTMGLAELLVGAELLNKARSAAGYLDQARTLAARYKPKPLYEYPERFKGEDIHFPVTRGYPSLWIRQIRISGGSDSEQHRNYIHLAGTISNISSDQRMAGAPLTIALEGTRGGTLTLGLTGQIDRRGELPVDHYSFRIRGLRPGRFSLGKADFLPAVATSPLLAGQFQVTIPGSAFDASGSLELRSLELAYANEPRNLGERLARDVLSGITGFDAGFRIWRGGEGVRASFSTNLDDQFADGVRRVVGAELTRLQNQLRERVEKEVAARRLEFERYFAAQKEQALLRIDGYRKLVEENRQMIEERKKELEIRLEQAKKGALDKAMDKLLKRN